MCKSTDLELTLDSNTFADLKEDFDGVLKRTVANMEMKGAEEATVTVKMTIKLEKTTVYPPEGAVNVTRPTFKHDVSSVMQVKDKRSGQLAGEMALVYDPDSGDYVLRPISNGQISIYDEEPNGRFVDYETCDDDEPAGLPEGPRGLPAPAESSDSDEDGGDDCEAPDAAENSVIGYDLAGDYNDDSFGDFVDQGDTDDDDDGYEYDEPEE